MTALLFEIRGPFDRETEGTVPHLQVHEITTAIITAATTILNSIAQPLIPEALPHHGLDPTGETVVTSNHEQMSLHILIDPGDTTIDLQTAFSSGTEIFTPLALRITVLKSAVLTIDLTSAGFLLRHHHPVEWNHHRQAIPRRNRPQWQESVSRCWESLDQVDRASCVDRQYYPAGAAKGDIQMTLMRKMGEKIYREAHLECLIVHLDQIFDHSSIHLTGRILGSTSDTAFSPRDEIFLIETDLCPHPV